MKAKLYLAGPEVFHPRAVEIGAAKKALCERHGLVGLYPLDGGSPDTDSAAIYASCLAMMSAADGGIFNLTPFRGVSADVGTVFELGVMAAMGRPVFAYSHCTDDLLARLKAQSPLKRDGAVWRDADGLMVEDFGNADNLMIDETLARQGRALHLRAVDAPAADRLASLEGFAACVTEAAAFFAAGRDGNPL